jgi:hypothetical protein
MTRAMMNAKRSKLPDLPPCPHVCDGCRDVSGDIDDNGLCENCSPEDEDEETV